jgi:hypothetical protein
MAPDSIHAESTVTIRDSCNQCCCFQFRRKPKNPVECKTDLQASKISKHEEPVKLMRSATEMHLTIKKDDVEIISGEGKEGV